MKLSEWKEEGRGDEGGTIGEGTGGKEKGCRGALEGQWGKGGGRGREGGDGGKGHGL